MNHMITKQADNYLEALAEALEVPASRYEQAEKSYKSLGEWLNRTQSAIEFHRPEVYVQGSFRLGTVIKPINENEEYDIDCVLVLNDMSNETLHRLVLKIWLVTRSSPTAMIRTCQSQ